MSDITYSPFKLILAIRDSSYFASELFLVVLILFVVLGGPPVGLDGLLFCLGWRCP